jgi:hypothetical protein
VTGREGLVARKPLEEELDGFWRSLRIWRDLCAAGGALGSFSEDPHRMLCVVLSQEGLYLVVS